MKKLHILVLGFIALNSLTSFACKSPDYSYWLNLKDAELRKEGCVREQVLLEIFSSKNEIEKVIKLGKRLRKKDILDSKSLSLEADALFSVKRFKEALKVFLDSKKALKVCQMQSTCGRFEFSDAIEHYEYYKYFHAVGFNDKANIELKLGDSAFKKQCHSQGIRADYCQEVKARLFQMVTEQNSK